MKKITIEPITHNFIFATPSAAEQPLSKTFMYVANTTGELLFSTQLTQQMLWRMVSQRPKIKSKETKMILYIETAIKISEKMPDYFYMYFGPKKLLYPNGEPIPFPLVIEKGQVLMFVVPK